MMTQQARLEPQFGSEPHPGRKGWLAPLTWGLLLTGLTTMIPYHYCETGNARGFPFAVYGPSCGGTFAAIGPKRDGHGGFVFDPLKLLGDVAVWGGSVAFVGSYFGKRW